MTWNSGRDPRGPPPPPLRMWRDDAWLAVAAPLLVFAGHALNGAMLPQTALVLSAAGALIAAVCLLRPRLRNDLRRLSGLRLPSLLFAIVIAVALWSLTPFVPGGAHPVWGYLHIPTGASTIDKGATLLEIVKLLGLACIFTLGLAIGSSDGRSRLAINTMTGLGAIYAAWAFLQFIGDRSATGGRLEGAFLTANTAGTVFAVLLMVSLGPAMTRILSGTQVAASRLAPFAVAPALLLACLIATASRGAFAAAAVGLAVLGAILVASGRMKWTRAAALAAAAVGALVLLLLVGGDLLVNRLMTSVHDFNARTAIARVHWQAFLDSPLFGYGLGTFDTVNRMLLNAENFPRIWSVRAAHNLYLAWLEQGGLIGALPMFACVATLILTTLRRSLRRSRMVAPLFALIAADAVYLAHGASDFALEMFSVASMWSLLLGIQFALSQGSSKR